jgi:hypothetical protein
MIVQCVNPGNGLSAWVGSAHSCARHSMFHPTTHTHTSLRLCSSCRATPAISESSASIRSRTALWDLFSSSRTTLGCGTSQNSESPSTAVRGSRITPHSTPPPCDKQVSKRTRKRETSRFPTTSHYSHVLHALGVVRLIQLVNLLPTSAQLRAWIRLQMRVIVTRLSSSSHSRIGGRKPTRVPMSS